MDSEPTTCQKCNFLPPPTALHMRRHPPPLWRHVHLEGKKRKVVSSSSKGRLPCQMRSIPSPRRGVNGKCLAVNEREKQIKEMRNESDE